MPKKSHAHKTTAPVQRDSRCWNCWSTKHQTQTCPRPPLSVKAREELRIELDLPRPQNSNYSSILRGDRPCFNCWASTEHGYPSCSKEKLGVEEKEKLRIKMGIGIIGAWKKVIDEAGFKEGGGKKEENKGVEGVSAGSSSKVLARGKNKQEQNKGQPLNPPHEKETTTQTEDLENAKDVTRKPDTGDMQTNETNTLKPNAEVIDAGKKALEDLSQKQDVQTSGITPSLEPALEDPIREKEQEMCKDVVKELDINGTQTKEANTEKPNANMDDDVLQLVKKLEDMSKAAKADVIPSKETKIVPKPVSTKPIEIVTQQKATPAELTNKPTKPGASAREAWEDDLEALLSPRVMSPTTDHHVTNLSALLGLDFPAEIPKPEPKSTGGKNLKGPTDVTTHQNETQQQNNNKINLFDDSVTESAFPVLQPQTDDTTTTKMQLPSGIQTSTDIRLTTDVQDYSDSEDSALHFILPPLPKPGTATVAQNFTALESKLDSLQAQLSALTTQQAETASKLDAINESLKTIIGVLSAAPLKVEVTNPSMPMIVPQRPLVREPIVSPTGGGGRNSGLPSILPWIPSPIRRGRENLARDTSSVGSHSPSQSRSLRRPKGFDHGW